MFLQPKQEVGVSCRYQPVLWITPEVVTEMAFIAKNAKIEVGWLGLINRLNKSHFVLDHIYIPKQEASTHYCDIDEQGVNHYAMWLCENGMEDRINDIRFWGHTHANLSITESVQDVKQLDKLCKNVSDYMVRLIINNRNEWNMSIAFPQENIEFSNVPWSYYLPGVLSDERREELLYCMKNNVTRAKVGNRYSGYESWNYPSKSMQPINDYIDHSGTVVDLHENSGCLEEEEFGIIPSYEAKSYVELENL